MPSKNQDGELATRKPVDEQIPLRAAHDDNDGSRASADLDADDDDVIREEDERERLIVAEGSGRHNFQAFKRMLSNEPTHGDGRKLGRRERRRRERTAKRQRRRGQQPETMYEMEEGDTWTGSDTSRDSSEADKERLGNLLGRKSVCNVPFGEYHL
jgi:hypothetical protein